jgi:hypothetical protein
MTPLFRKLNLGDRTVIHVLNAPATFEAELAALEGVAVKRSVSGHSGFAMAFVITEAQRDSASRKLAKACSGDAIAWMCYPKGTSKKYRCEFSRDSGWAVLAAAGFETVRIVAIDEDWTALRFRRVEYVRPTCTRSTNAVDAYMAALKHPHKEAVEELRALILSVDKRVKEDVKWKAPSFLITDHFATLRLHPAPNLQVILHAGAKARPSPRQFVIDDTARLLKWAAPGRCVAAFSSVDDVRVRAKAFKAIVRAWIAQL